MSRYAELEVQVGRGPLVYERSLMFDGAETSYESWADADQVKVVEQEDALEKGQARGLVSVLVVSEDAERQRVLVELPREVVMGGRRVWVKDSTLRR